MDLLVGFVLSNWFLCIICVTDLWVWFVGVWFVVLVFWV